MAEEEIRALRLEVLRLKQPHVWAPRPLWDGARVAGFACEACETPEMMETAEVTDSGADLFCPSCRTTYHVPGELLDLLLSISEEE